MPREISLHYAHHQMDKNMVCEVIAFLQARELISRDLSLVRIMFRPSCERLTIIHTRTAAVL